MSIQSDYGSQLVYMSYFFRRIRLKWDVRPEKVSIYIFGFWILKVGDLFEIVKRTFNVLQTFCRNMCVNLRCLAAFMPQQLLNVTQIGAAF